MPSSDYTSAGGGLKLKGAKSAGIDKKRKKSKKEKSTHTTADKKAGETADAEALPDGEQSVAQHGGTSGDGSERERSALSREPETRGKTEAEIRHEEMRRKRLDERLKREGVKTHKERVEHLNKYLSTLSEHHDMPRIGPG
ncbi:hypothetical protein AAFC00_004809 [Neodothiora populina]|uniref:DUF1754-domain-containing protein n=1 Tax=Neodothiora populina TaxID=2781224 RepID=A0ABR3P3E4_9PEZI